MNGDSGSVCVDEDERAVGLIVAADDPSEDRPARAYAIPFWLIADEFGIRDEHLVEEVVVEY